MQSGEVKCTKILQTLALGLFLSYCAGPESRDSSSSENSTISEKVADDYVIPENGPPGMVWVPGGEFIMGAIDSDMQARIEEKPAHRVKVDGFWMDKHEITNAQFKEFVQATGYVTIAEMKPDWNELKKQLPPGTPKPHDSVLIAASMVFTPIKTENLVDWSQWWKWVPGADWKSPQGPESSIVDKSDHPVVQVSWEDAQAYLKWAGKRFPTEAEWEFAARGGLSNKLYPWGDEKKISVCGNTFQGKFPEYNSEEDGYATTAPVMSYEPNGYGLYDMAGNVWEWTSDWFNVDYFRECADQGLVVNPQGAANYYDPLQPYMPQRVQRGGSFLCNESYCSSYRSSARMHSSPDTGQDHVGFRGVMSQETWSKIRETKQAQ